MAKIIKLYANCRPVNFDEDGGSEHGCHDAAIRKLLTEVMRSCSKSRAQIAEEMSRLTGLHITANMLYGYSAKDRRPARFPAVFVPAFCKATGDFRLQKMLLDARMTQLVETVERELDAARQACEARALRDQLIQNAGEM